MADHAGRQKELIDTKGPGDGEKKILGHIGNRVTVKGAQPEYVGKSIQDKLGPG